MAYDPEKYRHKREKVLGIKKRGVRFQTLAAIISVCILGGLALAALPGTVTWVTTRNLDDAIYKLKSGETWPETTMEEIRSIPGVRQADTDKHESRLVITFDRTLVVLERFSTIFFKCGIEAVLLNRLNHKHRMSIQKEEEAFEAP